MHEQLVANEGAQPTAVDVNVVRSTSGDRVSSTSPDPEVHCQQMFLNAISRINSNNLNVGKDEKVNVYGCFASTIHTHDYTFFLSYLQAMRFFCLGLRCVDLYDVYKNNMVL